MRPGRHDPRGPAALRGGASRAVARAGPDGGVVFSAPVDPGAYTGPGVGEVRVEGGRHRFALTGDPRGLLAALSRLPVEDVAIERAGLEEAFRDLYGEGRA